MNADSMEVQQDGLLLELLQHWLLYLWLLWHLAQHYFPVALEQAECNQRLQINPRRVVLDITLQQVGGMNLWKARKKKLLLAPVQALSKSGLRYHFWQGDKYSRHTYSWRTGSE